ncbi:MAG: NUDIX hydrolase [Candidatus Uhrbacteria bacterium GW2011_GWE2_40_58]|nr:MAG: NUDIX hydrolase [Candidatus Uhrbacteria bacterium GW2011_GWF2_40_263]KKR67851.1 MAG: NUDIX hydrolase [Candidatus Uhrbacteria bacterium GW2011_GWE2_40_58]OGL92559.1 MAG: hypothetical protein A2239_04725 [Candidatus Uhrbacteria bacterium RIFOXYA2_FULL_40_9]OGL96823.1 MAG: hypothetical protein A2332_02190 [Candidatus Uhrbacteria bacterium RIFOXYB2_FULL_41_18]HBK34919.1 NUDIX hydrolase [Candidatus Uhrbacteria bacterium]
MATKTIKQTIKIAVDSVIFTVQAGELKVLLIQMKKKPFAGMWAVPGGLIEQQETTEQAARRILKAQTAMSNVYLEQLKTFDHPKRDPLTRTISVAHFALVIGEDVTLKTTDKYTDVRWWSLSHLPTLAYDHKEMIQDAVGRLQAKLEYTNVVWSLLPKDFTLTDLQRIYEIILGISFDKRNFRKKILSLNLIKKSGKQRKGEANRPAELYQFKHRILEYIDVL